MNIEEAVQALPGIIRVAANFSSESVELEYDSDVIKPPAIAAAVNNAVYGLRKLEKAGKTDRIKRIAVIVAAVIGIAALLSLDKFFASEVSLEDIGARANYGILFLIGILTSFHCIGMCGGFVLGYASAGGGGTAKAQVLRHAAYLGSERIVTLRATRVWGVVPAEIVVVHPRKQWSYAGHPYLSGEIASSRLDVPALRLVALALSDEGAWDPAEEYWGEEGQPIEEWAKPIIARGPRPAFEMQQVLPGADPDDPDSDPICDSNDLKDAGDPIAARTILMKLRVRSALPGRPCARWQHRFRSCAQGSDPPLRGRRPHRSALARFCLRRRVALGPDRQPAHFSLVFTGGGILLWIAALVMALSLRKSDSADFSPRYHGTKQILHTLRDDLKPGSTFLGHLDLTGALLPTKIPRSSKDLQDRTTEYFRDEWLALKAKLYDGSILRLSAIQKSKKRKSYWKRSRISGKMKSKPEKFKGSEHDLKVRNVPNPEVYTIARTSPKFKPGLTIGKFTISQLSTEGGMVAFVASSPFEDVEHENVLQVLQSAYSLLQRKVA